ncbi:scavenger receptor class F member 1-like [Haliotis rubra]|uniref:scavenger receptor class F member 1-like n=1 Tax=Haliotis rubra TaxID=36100 RepID=UPI001EE5E5CF|nr:scavenger receptor class F member 1-like [Haliotis rubra]
MRDMLVLSPHRMYGYLLVGLLTAFVDCTETCPPEFWGPECDEPCPTNCDEEESTKKVYCDKPTGNCAEGCKAGYYKPRCDERCKDCTSGRCMQVDGACLPGGSSGVLHPNTLLIVLVILNPVYGNRIAVITLTLSYLVASVDACGCTYCKDLQCDSSGHCLHGCAESHNYGPKCQYECPNNCIDLQCTVATNGQPKCTTGCKDGFRGTQCNIPCNKRCGRCNGSVTCMSCSSHYFGPDCQSDCTEKCKGMSCNPDGTCRPDTCVDGWYGQYCHMKCPSICKTCDKVKRTCTSCDVGWYGLDCADQCPQNPDSTFCSRLRDADICPVCAYKSHVKPDICRAPSKWNRPQSVGLLCLSTMTVLALITA